MKVAVAGLWHLGSVTAACLASAGHEVTAYDPDQAMVTLLQQGRAPVYEPGLDALIAAAKNNLQFSCNPQEISTAEILWVAFDTPVDDDDIADVDLVCQEIEALLPWLQNNALVIISSQVPVGTTRKLKLLCDKLWQEKNISFCYSPENLRLGKAISVFTKPDRVVAGIEKDSDKERIADLLRPFTDNIVWMSIESAEMTKHAINAFLATSVVFINELATLCERVGADAREVEKGLKSEERIGPKAYLRPGAAIGGGTLARDVKFLIQKGEENQVETPFLSALLNSNHAHKQWSCKRVLQILESLEDKTIATLGLTYKAGTDTLRRSTAVETCQWLKDQGARVVAYDPVVTNLPEDLKFIDLKPSLDLVLMGADAVIVTTEWPQFAALTPDQFIAKVKQPIIIDASGFLMKMFSADKRVNYYSVGTCQ